MIKKMFKDEFDIDLLDNDPRWQLVDPPLKPFDYLVIDIPNQPRCYVLYVEEGIVIHNRERVAYKGPIRHFTTAVFRHRDVPNLEPKVTAVSLMDYLLPHKRAMLEKAMEDAKNK